jgi:Fe-S-cluster containining protein
MLKLSDAMRAELNRAVEQASTRPEVRAAVEDLYARLGSQIEERKPKCDASGRCCRFEEYGHRLFVTTIELATFLASALEGEAPAEPKPRISSSLALQVMTDAEGCPYQVEGLCSVHSVRPFGCRIFFCDPSAQDWQKQRYEMFHAELMRLHEQFGISYFYVEWREALRALQLPGKVVLSRT